MPTDIRPELSKKNGYYISKHRYYELKHFCLQYNEWKKAIRNLESSLIRTPQGENVDGGTISNPTMEIAMMLQSFNERIKLIDDTLSTLDEGIQDYVKLAVTDGASYTTLRMCNNIPYCKNIFYDNYRAFFHSLSRIRK